MADGNLPWPAAPYATRAASRNNRPGQASGVRTEKTNKVLVIGNLAAIRSIFVIVLFRDQVASCSAAASNVGGDLGIYMQGRFLRMESGGNFCRPLGLSSWREILNFNAKCRILSLTCVVAN
jgi:hypothetical protein